MDVDGPFGERALLLLTVIGRFQSVNELLSNYSRYLIHSLPTIQN